tara:strand:- start:419 stop:994 length:576 start_codon:yes stop_codon:yes gene_type:complete
MKLRILLSFILVSFHSTGWGSDLNHKKNYCVGYFEELYWSLDPIEEEEIRKLIKNFFNKNLPGSSQLDFDLFYDSKTKQFIPEWENIDTSKYIKVNYPNFEIIILDAYINLFKEGENYCPAFWDNCEEDSLNSFFKAAEEYSDIWRGEENVISFLDDNFLNHQCSSYLRTSINQKEFISDINILIKELTKK